MILKSNTDQNGKANERRRYRTIYLYTCSQHKTQVLVDVGEGNKEAGDGNKHIQN